MTCQSTDKPDGTHIIACSADNSQCTTQESPDGTVTETCTVSTSGKAPTPGNPNAPMDPNSAAPTDPNTVTGTTGGTTAGATGGAATGGTTAGGTTTGGTSTGGTGSTGTGSADGSGNGVSERCTTTLLPDGGSSVTCTCNVHSGNCAVNVGDPNSK
jgi:hypothetical protein